ncbi:RNA polymerase II RPB7 subunit-like protein (nucleomorph) [Chroomonas mesostigmatica CCMP1168]|uniref:RNA polymerase II RPB7 subunit-like protein n=1 Tax=Chroomonas mesostigmatica CCMP1168 TaxID=1195612 RepID=J7G2I7_9CRYP|nr:RNA polymerase II RPB7 subunit-like protein [Chroomonas mesostigmatica CCMP1168]|mmetsp:Transcript_65895/g.162213  ORF Transcript_65895/g.162213 Transcript_65895/m.162213 type:complete len:175 (+) Transcript_65895:305-829(+)
MYFLCTLNQNLYVSPKLFNKKIKKSLVGNLLSSVEGTKAGPFGLIIMITEIFDNWGEGKFLIGCPSALYCLTYKALTFRAFKGEVFDAVVTQVTNLGFFSEAGFLQIFVSKKQIPIFFKYNQNKRTFFNQLEQKESISTNSTIRVRVVSIKEESSFNQALGSIKGKKLGLLEQY